MAEVDQVKPDFEASYFQTYYPNNYDKQNPPSKFRMYLAELKKHLPVSNSAGRKKLLEVGCAYGSFLEVARADFDVVGSDISAHAIEMAGKRLNVPLFNAGVLELDLTPESFDLICCFDILEHVPELDAAIVALKQALKPGGSLVFSVPVYDTAIGALVRILDKDPTHVHKNSRNWWLEKMRQHGFVLNHWTALWRYMLNPLGYIHFMNQFSRSFGPGIFVIVSVPQSDQ